MACYIWHSSSSCLAQNLRNGWQRKLLIKSFCWFHLKSKAIEHFSTQYTVEFNLKSTADCPDHWDKTIFSKLHSILNILCRKDLLGSDEGKGEAAQLSIVTFSFRSTRNLFYSSHLGNFDLGALSRLVAWPQGLHVHLLGLRLQGRLVHHHSFHNLCKFKMAVLVSLKMAAIKQIDVCTMYSLVKEFKIFGFLTRGLCDKNSKLVLSLREIL